MLEPRSVDISCVQDIKFRRKSFRMISGKRAEYKLFWIGNGKCLGGVGIVLAKKWLDKVIDVSRVSDKRIVINVLIQRIIVSVISVYAPQCRLAESQKDDFYYSRNYVVRNLGQRKL